MEHIQQTHWHGNLEYQQLHLLTGYQQLLTAVMLLTLQRVNFTYSVFVQATLTVGHSLLELYYGLVSYRPSALNFSVKP